MLRKFTSSTNISSYSLTSGGNDCTLKTKQDQFWIGKYSYMTEKQRFLTIAEAAEFLHVSETSLRRWTNSGNLRCFRVGVRGERRFLVEDLLEFVASGKVQQEPPSTASGIIADTVSQDRKSTRLNSSHLVISYAVFCLKKKKKKINKKRKKTKKKKKNKKEQ